MDLTGKKRAALEVLLKRDREEIRELRGQIQWMLANASDEQIIAWAKDAMEHVGEVDDLEPDWEHRTSEILRHVVGENMYLKHEVERLQKELAELKGEQ